jgi:hypothetical protein
MEINSLFDIKFLYINAIEIIIINGVVSDIILGILNKDNNSNFPKFNSPFSNNLDISIIFINKINKVIITIF